MPDVNVSFSAVSFRVCPQLNFGLPRPSVRGLQTLEVSKLQESRSAQIPGAMSHLGEFYFFTAASKVCGSSGCNLWIIRMQLVDHQDATFGSSVCKLDHQDANCGSSGCNLWIIRMQFVDHQDAICGSSGCNLLIIKKQFVDHQDATCGSSGCNLWIIRMQLVNHQDATCGSSGRNIFLIVTSGS